jgi:hypothetical protein
LWNFIRYHEEKWQYARDNCGEICWVRMPHMHSIKKKRKTISVQCSFWA